MKRKFFVVAAVIISSQLPAQTDSAAKPLEEVIITANRYPNKTSLTGKVVTVITKEQLEKSGGKDLSQLLAEQAGVYIGGANSNAGKDKSIYLRGARVDHTLITIDGVPVYDPSGIGGNFDIRNFSADNIERIEILKGSQSTLYGSDAIAGVINIITKKAGAGSANSSGMLSYGSNNSFGGNAGLHGRKNKTAYYLNYSLHKTKGINEANSSNSNADKDGYTQNSVQIKLDFHAAKNIIIQPFLRYSKLSGDLDQGAFTDELDYTYRQKSFQTGIKNEISFGKLKLYALYNYNFIRREYVDDSIKSRNGFDIYSRGNYEGAEHFFDAFGHMLLSKKIKLSAGADYRRSASDQKYSSLSGWGSFTSEYSADSLKQNQLGIYAALNIHSGKGFTIETGGRLNFHSEYGSYPVFNLNPSLLINNKLKLFANFSSGYRTPSLYQLFSEYGNRKLKPEAAFTAEGGLQFFSSDNKVTGRAAAFSRAVKDLIFFYFNPVTFQSKYINEDKQKDHGAELELSYNISRQIFLKAFYTYVSGEVTTKTSGGKDTTYFNLLRRPKNSFGLNVSSNPGKRFLISTTISAFGKRNDAYFDPLTFQTVHVVLKKYILWDVFAAYIFVKNKIKIFADLRNVTGSRYTEVSGFNTLRFNAYAGMRFSL